MEVSESLSPDQVIFCDDSPASTKSPPSSLSLTGSWSEQTRTRYHRSRSMADVCKENYTPAEILRMRERLVHTYRNHRKPSAPGEVTHFTRKQKLTLTSLALVDFMSFCSMSIMAPFFPREAALKGVNDITSGFVFSFYAFVIFISSPIFGKILPRVGAKFLFMTGMFLAGVCNLIFGVLEYIDDFTMFTTFCFVVRGLEALGASAYSTASYVFVVNTFPDSIGSVLGILETFVGLGMSTGPAIGGLLYSFGGFGLPFYVLGILMIAVVPLNFLLLPSAEDCNVGCKTGSIFDLLKLPSVLVTGLVVVVVSNIWGFLDPTLEPHLRKFDLSPEKIGLIFLMFSALYGISSPGWGWLADRCRNHWSMMVFGLISCSIGLLLIGPSPFLAPFIRSHLWLDIVGLSILGVSVALSLLPTFQRVLTSAIEGGFQDSLATCSLVAGLWSCMYALGEVVGPAIGGVLLQNLGFPMAATVQAILCMALALLTFIYFVLKSSTCLTDEMISDSGISGSSWKSTTSSTASVDDATNEKRPLLGSRNKIKANATENNILYTEEKGYYTRNQKYQYNDEQERPTGIRKMIGITGSGSCEV